MKQQVLVIGGGNDFATYEEYLADLKAMELSLDRMRMRSWKQWLPEALGKRFDVIWARMPNAQNCKYLEWKIMFEKIIPLLGDEIIFVGHSQGGIFLAKYLSENDLPKKIKGLFLVAPPYSQSQNINSFALTQPLANVAKQCKNIHLFQSEDDPLVPFAEVGMYEKELPQAQAHIFKDRGHFQGEKFPEIAKAIKKIK